MTLLWHYTTMVQLQMILDSYVIRPATAGVLPGERPAVWFTLREDWEPTASKGLILPDGTRKWLGREGTYREFGLARLGVQPDVAPVSWSEYKRVSGCSSFTARGLEKAARKAGSLPGQWFVSFDPVSLDDLETIEEWDGSRWDNTRWVRTAVTDPVSDTLDGVTAVTDNPAG